MEELDKIFKELKKILTQNAKGMKTYKESIGSKAKIKKQSFHLYGKKKVSIFNNKPKQTFLAGIIKQKNYIGFYYSPIYSHPKKFKLSPELKKTLKGKTCFYIKEIDKELFKEINNLIKKGKKLYKEEKWI